MNFLPETHELLVFERNLWDKGFSFVAGIDEAGRGPLAGPVVAAAAAFARGAKIPPVNDSKKLSEKQRASLREQLLSTDGFAFAVVEISPEEIDRINILQATRLAMRKAASQLKKADFALIDGLPVPDFPLPSTAIVKGDSKSASIAAASIIAKTHRDAIMDRLAVEWPGYGFERHKGYGTADHVGAIKKLGPCPAHRMSFAPVRDVIHPPPSQGEFDLS